MRLSWNQSRQVTRLPVQLWKYSCAMTVSIAAKSRSVAGIGAGEHVRRVEDVEPLVLHRPHVEVVDRDDHEGVEVVLESVHLLVPAHRALERAHRVAAAVDVVRLHVDAQRHHAPRAGGEGVLDALEPARDQGEEVARLRIRVLPHHVTAAVVQDAAFDVVAVGKHHGVPPRVRDDAGAVPRHHVRAVEEPGDLPEPFGLALRAKVPRRRVEPLQRLVRSGPDGDLGFEHERAGSVADGQCLAGYLDAVSRNGLAVDAHRPSVESPAVEDQVRGRLGGGIAPDLESRPHQGSPLAELEVEVHFVDEERRRGIVRETRGGGFDGAHRRSSGWVGSVVRTPCIALMRVPNAIVGLAETLPFSTRHRRERSFPAFRSQCTRRAGRASG